MKLTLIILLFPFFISAQSIAQKWNSLTPEQKENLDHTGDFYARFFGSWGLSKFVYKKTGRKGLASLVGFSVSFITLFAERGLYGKFVAGGGAASGQFAFFVDCDVSERKQKEYLEKRRIFEN